MEASPPARKTAVSECSLPLWQPVLRFSYQQFCTLYLGIWFICFANRVVSESFECLATNFADSTGSIGFLVLQAGDIRIAMRDHSRFNTDRSYPGQWTITFSNPPINMLVPTTIVELRALMTELERDPSVKVVVFPVDESRFFHRPSRRIQGS